jgi:hypothetical protein
MEKIKLSKLDKILLALGELADSSKKNLKFEDIVVAIFSKFPEDFHLRGYKKYPDADIIRRSLYTFRENGMLLARNMIFSLTDKGIDEANKLRSAISKKKINIEPKLDRYVEKEIKRIKNLSAYKLYIKGKSDNILDTDFFDFLGISVKSDRIEFKSRMKTISDVDKAAKKIKDSNLNSVLDFYDFMIKRYREIIDYKLKN